MKRLLLSSILASLSCFFLAPVTFTYAGTSQLTNNEYNDAAVQFEGGKVLLSSNPDGNDHELFYYDIETGITTQITNNDYDESGVQVDNGKVVWLSYDGDWDVFLYDITTGITTQITNNNYDEWDISIDNGKIVWYGYTGMFPDIFLYDIATSTTTQITNTSSGESNPRVDNGKISWVGTDGHDTEIFLYDIATGTTAQITNNNYSDNNLIFNEGKMVWVGSEGDAELFMYNIATAVITQITNNNTRDSSPQINDDKIVWYGSDGDGEIFLYDILSGSTTQISHNDFYNDYDPQIDSEKIVWTGQDENDYEIFVYDISTNTTNQLTRNNYYDTVPLIDNGKVVWTGEVENDGEIFYWDGILPSNTPPVIASLQDTTINTGESYAATGSFTDNDSVSWSGTVDYGDGSGVQSLTLNENNFELNHVYTTTGTFTVTVVVTDDGALSDTETVTVTVINPEPVTLYPTADSYIKQGSPNENEGASIFMRLQSSGHNRAMIKFDQSQIENAVNGAQNYTAKLRFTITDNGNNWGPTGRTISLHRLVSNWTEGNGFIDDNNPAVRGTGSGTTWNCATDTNIQNQAKNCSGANDWNMNASNQWPFAAAATATTTITNNQSGVVEFDVTSDIQSFINGTNQNVGWLLKKENEGQNGKVLFGSKESANSPRLIITKN